MGAVLTDVALCVITVLNVNSISLCRDYKSCRAKNILFFILALVDIQKFPDNVQVFACCVILAFLNVHMLVWFTQTWLQTGHLAACESDFLLILCRDDGKLDYLCPCIYSLDLVLLVCLSAFNSP